MLQSARHITDCRIRAVVISNSENEENESEVSISWWDTELRGLQRVLSWETFQQTAVTGAFMSGHDHDKAQIRFTSDSHEKIKAVIVLARHALEDNRRTGAKSFHMSWAF